MYTKWKAFINVCLVNMKVSWFLLISKLSLSSLEAFPNIDQIIRKNNISTLMIFYERNLPNIETSVPKIVISLNLLPFQNIRSRNKNTLTIIFLETLNRLDRVSDQFQYALDSNLLIISENLKPISIFKRCFELDFPNVIINSNNSFLSYCFKYPIQIFSINLDNFLSQKWFNMFVAQNCKWQLEATSRRGLAEQLKELILYYCERMNADLVVTNPQNMTNRSNSMANLNNMNASSYVKVNFYKYLSIVLIVPIRASGADHFFLKPFDTYTWICFIGSVFYFTLILGILSKY